MTFHLHSMYISPKYRLEVSVAGKISREEAFRIYADPPHIESELLAYVKKRLGFSDQEFDDIMNMPRKSYKDYKTYKKTFERLRPLFFILARSNLVPMSFYIKYTSKDGIPK